MMHSVYVQKLNWSLPWNKRVSPLLWNFKSSVEIASQRSLKEAYKDISFWKKQIKIPASQIERSFQEAYKDFSYWKKQIKIPASQIERSIFII